MPRTFCAHWDGRVIGCPGTIDNDLAGTEVSIGFTSAVSTAAEAIDKVRDTADATERLFLVEVMGRHSGQIAVATALRNRGRCGACSRDPVPRSGSRRRLEQEKRSGKSSWIVIVAEGAITGGVHRIWQEMKELGATFDTGCSSSGTSSAAELPPFAIGSWPAAWGHSQSTRFMEVSR